MTRGRGTAAASWDVEAIMQGRLLHQNSPVEHLLALLDDNAVAGDTEHMPTTELTNDDFGGGAIDVLTLLVKCGLAASKGEARRLVQQGGVTVNDEKVSAIETTFGCEQFTGDGVIIKKGKKVFHRAVLV